MSACPTIREYLRGMSSPEWWDRPIVTLLVGVLITAGLAPFVARRWASRQKELEVKAALVSDVADTIMILFVSVMNARELVLASAEVPHSYSGFVRSRRSTGLTAIPTTLSAPPRGTGVGQRLRLSFLGCELSMNVNRHGARDREGTRQAVERMQDTKANFRVKRQVIGTRLEAYFGWSGIPELWDRLCDCAELLDTPPRQSAAGPDEARQRMNRLTAETDGLWRALGLTEASRQEAERAVSFEVADREWLVARMRLLHCKAEIIRRILRAPMPVFASKLSRSWRMYRKQEKTRSLRIS